MPRPPDIQFQKGVKADPTLAILPIRFFFGAAASARLAVAKHGSFARALIDIFRGTYLRTRPRLPLEKLGSFWLGIHLLDSNTMVVWEVYASDRKELHSVFTLQGKAVLLNRDPL
jgi:hypothetical protein